MTVSTFIGGGFNRGDPRSSRSGHWQKKDHKQNGRQKQQSGYGNGGRPMSQPGPDQGLDERPKTIVEHQSQQQRHHQPEDLLKKQQDQTGDQNTGQPG